MSFDLRILEGDLVIGKDGDLSKVEENDKLIQDILKIALTPLGSNVFHAWYGSPITQSLIGSGFDMEFTTSVASSQLRNSLEALQKLQKKQASYQQVTPGEQIAALADVRIERNIVDPRYFSVFIKALTNALTTVYTNFNLKPGL